MKERNSQRQVSEERTAYPQSSTPRGGLSNLWAGVIGGLTVLVLVLAYQLFTSRQADNTANNNQILPPVATAPSSIPQTPNIGNNSSVIPASPQVQETAPVTTSTAQTAVASSGVQPGQFVQSALNNKAQVELLKVNRILGQRDVVNVQVRLRALRPDKAVGSDSIYMGGTTARNPETSETYKDVNGESTGSVSLFQMRLQNQSSADAYVWLRVPEGVNIIDIYMPNTQAFKNVPIAS